MGVIRLLDDSVINKIAAGEVVERPASVIKELVENSLDAGATKISLELQHAGQKKILVRDNGSGMSQDDMKMSLVRHATSKISTENDLFDLHSMGFRGEALASISSVSKMTIFSSQGGNGAKLVCEGGEVSSLKPWWGERGSWVEVDDLFYNVPARGKFLRHESTEWTFCLDMVRSLALANPHVNFELKHNDKVRFSSKAITEKTTIFGEELLRKHAEILFEKDEIKNSLYVFRESTHGNWEALVSTPGFESASSKNMHTFVNSRPVQDKVIRMALQRAYHSHLLKGKYPKILGFLHIDPTLIDVNVHPTKSQVRFQYPSEVQHLISTPIREALASGLWSQPARSFELTPQRVREYAPAPSPRAWSNAGRFLDEARDDEGCDPSSRAHDPSSRVEARGPLGFAQGDGEYDLSPRAQSRDLPLFREKFQATHVTSRTSLSPLSLWENTPDTNEGKVTSKTLQQMTYLGAFAGCYLIFTDEEDLALVDQHALHERILYEQFLKDPKLIKNIQPLITPEEVLLHEHEIENLKQMQGTLEDLGFLFEILSEKGLEVKAIPQLLEGRDLTTLFSELAQENPSSSNTVEKLAHHTLSTLACHSAVRKGDLLNADQVQWLLKESDKVDFFHNCPHGRRVMRFFRRREVEGWFDRV